MGTKGPRREEFLAGVRAEAPILLGVAPFGVIFGAIAMNAGLGRVASQAMSSVIFAGSAQFVSAQLLGAGASAAVIVMVVFVVNLRHALYSASVAPHIRHLHPAWKAVLAYLLTDEAYAVVITHYNADGDKRYKHWYFLGAGLTLWSSWQVSTAVGILIGSGIPSDWPLGLVLPLTFIALVAPTLKDRAGVAAAVTAGLIGFLSIGLPYKTGLLLAAFAGIIAGVIFERRTA